MLKSCKSEWNSTLTYWHSTVPRRQKFNCTELLPDLHILPYHFPHKICRASIRPITTTEPPSTTHTPDQQYSCCPANLSLRYLSYPPICMNIRRSCTPTKRDGFGPPAPSGFTRGSRHSRTVTPTQSCEHVFSSLRNKIPQYSRIPQSLGIGSPPTGIPKIYKAPDRKSLHAIFQVKTR